MECHFWRCDNFLSQPPDKFPLGPCPMGPSNRRCQLRCQCDFQDALVLERRRTGTGKREKPQKMMLEVNGIRNFTKRYQKIHGPAGKCISFASNMASFWVSILNFRGGSPGFPHKKTLGGWKKQLEKIRIHDMILLSALWFCAKHRGMICRKEDLG